MIKSSETTVSLLLSTFLWNHLLRTDKWAETELGTKWGDKWEEKFFAGIGSRQGETWHLSPAGERMSSCFFLTIPFSRNNYRNIFAHKFELMLSVYNPHPMVVSQLKLQNDSLFVFF